MKMVQTTVFAKYLNLGKKLLSQNWVKAFLGALIALILIFFGLHIFYWSKIYPGIKIAGEDVSGKTVQEAEATAIHLTKPEKLTFVWKEEKFELSTSQIEVGYRNEKTAERAFDIGRKGGIIRSFRDKWKALARGINLPHSISVNSEKLDVEIEKIAQNLQVTSVEPSINIQNKKVIVNPGKSGQEVNKEELREKIFQHMSFGKKESLDIPINLVNPQLSHDQVKILEERANKILGKQVKINFEKKTFVYTDQNLVTILGDSESFINKDKAQTFSKDLAHGVNRDPQNAKFVFEENKVKEFTQSMDGIAVDEEKLTNKLNEAIKELVETGSQEFILELPVQKTMPETANQDVNSLGINELIGQGESNYRGSISARIHNLSLAAARLNGVLIKPGEEFSFNKTVGDISLATGYKQAFVIKDGKTILDDGGGVCQVSTTFFRTALNSGLPILERHQHSYRVSYYENGSKPGYDAAIYLPNIDLRIKNDTPGHILIQTKNDTKNSKLVFEFYGTNDGRQSQILNYRQWDARPAPPDLHQDDPTLPAGTTKQVEKAIAGLKTAFDYKVTRGEEIIFEKTFTSNFRPWQAVYLHGTGATE